ncbi:MAG: hypothetical protein Q4G35_08350 [Propionibacteriaceae bacterium]|nr:hypothetical protein [Propionibacteriaceae bacterium]
MALGIDEVWLGVGLMALGVGGISGALLAPVVGKRVGRFRSVAGSTVLMGLAVGSLGLIPAGLAGMWVAAPLLLFGRLLRHVEVPPTRDLSSAE